MLLNQLDEMSIGPIWLLRAREEASVDIVQSNAICPVCKMPWLQSTDKDSAIIAVLASPLTDEAQQKLLKNCLAAAGWFEPALFSLHATCSVDMTNTLAAFNEQIAAQSPDLVIVFGIDAAQRINQELTRGSVHYFTNTRLVVTYHPAEMIATPALKAEVWADLCLLR